MLAVTIIMNDDEIRVENFLRERGHNDVICWPDGPNEPPDFLIEGSIAIEVRRLNQNHAAGFETQGLEVVSKKLIDSIRSIALSLGPPTRGRSWFVSIDFRRPVGELKTLRALITEKLRDFIARDCHQEITFRISDTVAIQLAPSDKMHRTFFVIGGWVDGDSGGWLIPEMTKNISLCVDEKARKIARVRHKYPQGGSFSSTTLVPV